MTPTQCIVQVALPRPLFSLFSYSLPNEMQAVIGGRVSVPFGSQESIGVVVAIDKKPLLGAETGYTLKTVSACIDQEPVVDEAILTLLQWAARYYHHPLGEVILTALPVALRKPKPISTRIQKKIAKACSAVPHSIVTEPTLHLTSAQQTCLNDLLAWLGKKQPKPTLLQGVTGSGKTEIYVRLIEPILAQGKQVLILVPEIGLTPQLILRLTHYFGEVGLVSLHSALTDGERLKVWLQAMQGQARIVIGTRSAIFTPMPNLGLMIIDEEHDASFKQQEGLRYHGRDLAIKRAQLLNIPILLGTATPSLESLYNAQTGRFHYIRLNQRPYATTKPKLQLQDTRGLALQAGLSQLSLKAIKRTLERGEQVMIFLNRRGFAPTLYCPACGWQAMCEHCSVNMTWHARQDRLLCHHCGAEQPTPAHCPQCQHPQLTTQGQGTERLEILLQNHFSSYPVVRFDRDATQTKGALADKLEQVRSNEPLILVGTQMVAKGHDFPNLTLVVIVDIDQSLWSTDYRALERLGQLIVQVAGRAGRAHKAGHVILQTAQPDNPLLQQLISQGYTVFAQQLLDLRRRWNFPPFGYQALIRASSAQTMDKALAWLEQVSQLLANLALPALQRLGPVPAPLEKRANRYRAQLLLGSVQRAVLHQALHHLQQQEKAIPGRAGIRWSMDVDPVDFS